MSLLCEPGLGRARRLRVCGARPARARSQGSACVSPHAQDAGSSEEWALCGRAEHPAAAAADLQPPRAGGAPAPGVLLHGGAAAVPLGLAHPEGA